MEVEVGPFMSYHYIWDWVSLERRTVFVSFAVLHACFPACCYKGMLKHFVFKEMFKSVLSKCFVSNCAKGIKMWPLKGSVLLSL